jgi:hypothetical protein
MASRARSAVRPFLLLAVGSALTAGCGSTVQLREQIATQPGLLQGAGPTGQPAVGGTGPLATDVPVAKPGPRNEGSVSRPSGPTQHVAPRGTPEATVAIRGVTPTTITIGVITNDGVNGVSKQFGVKNADTGDQRATNEAIINYLNASGGFAGRKISPVFYEVDTSNYINSASNEGQRACESFTTDNNVYAVASGFGWVDNTFYGCLHKADVIVSASGEFVSDPFLRSYPNVYAPLGINTTRLLRTNVDALFRAGWFASSPRIGVVAYDNAGARAAVRDGLIPALKSHGLALSGAVYVASTFSGASDYSSAVLKFQSEGITHVMFAQAQMRAFSPVAASQRYYPKYALDSYQLPATAEANSSPDELRGSMGVGWMPGADLAPSMARRVVTPGLQRCVSAVRAAGQNLEQGLALWTTTRACDAWFLLRDTIARANRIPTTPDFLRTVEAGGTSFGPAGSFQTAFSPQRLHDGVSQYRLVAYQDACSCFRYASDVRPTL